MWWILIIVLLVVAGILWVGVRFGFIVVESEDIFDDGSDDDDNTDAFGLPDVDYEND